MNNNQESGTFSSLYISYLFVNSGEECATWVQLKEGCGLGGVNLVVEVWVERGDFCNF